MRECRTGYTAVTGSLSLSHSVDEVREESFGDDRDETLRSLSDS